MSNPSDIPALGEFAQRPRVRQLVLRYERRPHVNPDAQRDLAAWAALTLKLDPLDVAVLVGALLATDGGPAFEPEQDGPVAQILSELQRSRQTLERLVRAHIPRRRAGNKPNLARRILVHGLALEWESMGLVVGISRNAHADTATGPFVRAVVAAASHLPEHLRLTSDTVAAEVETLRKEGKLQRRRRGKQSD